MKKILIKLKTEFMFIALLAFIFSSFSSRAQNEHATMSNMKAAQIIKDWPETANKAANSMIEKYGEPDGKTSTMLVWDNTGPFKRTIVYKEEVQHNFPMPHKDVLEQFLDYKVPAEKCTDLAKFDGSVLVDITRGEMSARCDKEGANILALNLADDIITGKRTIYEARQFYADAIMEMLQGNKVDYIKSLQFKVVREDVGHTDEAIMDMSKVNELMKK